MKFRSFLFIFVAGFLLSQCVHRDSVDREHLERLAIIAGHNDCMERAGELGCHMTPADFVEYYKAKGELEARL